MMENKLLISIENNALKIKRTTLKASDRDFLIVDLELDEIKSLAPSEAAYRLGACLLIGMVTNLESGKCHHRMAQSKGKVNAECKAGR